MDEFHFHDLAIQVTSTMALVIASNSSSPAHIFTHYLNPSEVKLHGKILNVK